MMESLKMELKRVSQESLFSLLTMSLALRKSDRCIRGRIPNECYLGLRIREYWENGEHHVEGRAR